MVRMIIVEMWIPLAVTKDIFLGCNFSGLLRSFIAIAARYAWVEIACSCLTIERVKILERCLGKGLTRLRGEDFGLIWKGSIWRLGKLG